jgi:hypothetical protein
LELSLFLWAHCTDTAAGRVDLLQRFGVEGDFTRHRTLKTFVVVSLLDRFGDFFRAVTAFGKNFFNALSIALWFRVAGIGLRWH